MIINKNFVGHPKTGKLEVISGDPGAGVISYQYNMKKINNSDISHILRIISLLLGSLEDVAIIMNPVSSGSLKVHLSVKNRSNIELGMFQLGRSAS